MIKNGKRLSVFRAQEQEMACKAELFQSGVELIGKAGAMADAEIKVKNDKKAKKYPKHGVFFCFFIVPQT
jgi:hypothetical protein